MAQPQERQKYHNFCQRYQVDISDQQICDMCQNNVLFHLSLVARRYAILEKKINDPIEERERIYFAPCVTKCNCKK